MTTNENNDESQTVKSTKESEKTFKIEKGDQEHLTEFQRQKAKYFFNVNLDIENKEHVTWEDVEFYLLFHITIAGKEGDIESRLSHAARAFWEHVHDEIPLEDGKRDRLTLDQFLDTWASLIDSIVLTNDLPSIVNDLVQLGFELYSTKTDDGKATIQLQAFEQLFQKMNLSRPFAIMAYNYLTDKGQNPLDAEKIDSIVKAIITSSDDEHESHFLLPGFFKTITINKVDEEKEKSPSPPPSSTTQQKEEIKPSSPPSSPAPPSKESPPPSPSPPKAEQPEKPAEAQTETPKSSANEVRQKPQTIQPPKPQKITLQQEDDNIRRLLHYYHIDDGDVVEVAGGSVQRLVLLHPERPLPAYIQQNKQLLQKLQPDLSSIPPVEQNGSTDSDKTPKVTLEERISRGETPKGPTIPTAQDKSSPTNVRQIYPQINPAQQFEQQRQAKIQSENDNDISTASKNDRSKQSKDISHQEEEKIISNVLKQLAPIVEKRVAAELRRLQNDDTDKDDDDDDMIPFPFMLGGGMPFFAGPPPNMSGQAPPQQTNGSQGADFGGIPPPGAGLFPPPQLLMAMMRDLASGGLAPDMPLPSNGPGGFMMFVDENQLLNGGAGPRPF